MSLPISPKEPNRNEDTFLALASEKGEQCLGSSPAPTGSF